MSAIFCKCYGLTMYITFVFGVKVLLVFVLVVYDLSKESSGRDHTSLTANSGADFFAMEAFVNAMWVGDILFESDVLSVI